MNSKFKKIFNYIVVLLLIVSNLLLAENKKKQYIISTGSYGGNYYKTGEYVSKALNRFDDNYKFITIESNGASNNIENLKNGIADFTIVQRNILLQNLYNEAEGITNIEVILPLFQERLIIYIHDSVAISFDQFKKKIELSKIQNIGLVNKKGSTYKTFTTISKLLHIHLSQEIFYVDNYSNLIKKFKKNDIDAIVTFSLPIIEIESLKNANKVFLNENEVDLLENRIANVSKIPFSLEKESSYSIGSWNFLIGLNKSVTELETNGKSISTHLAESFSNSNELIPKMISNSLKLYKGSEDKYKDFINGIPINENLLAYLGYQRSSHVQSIGIFLVIFIVILVLYYLNRKYFAELDSYLLWLRFRHIAVGISIVVILYFLSVEILIQSETTFLHELDLKSKLLNLTKNDLHLWLLIRNLTGNDSGIFPLSSIGKIMVSFPSYIFLLGLFFIAISEYIVRRMSYNRRKGILKLRYKNHLVIVGWNDTTYKLIEETINAIKNYRESSEKIVCIVKNTEDILSKYKTISVLHNRKIIDFIQGESREEQVLELANIHLAKTVVLLSENNSISADEKTLLRALEISRYCRQKSITQSDNIQFNKNFKSYNTEKYVDSIYIIAEINDDKYKKDLLNSDVNEIVSTSNYGNNILTQSMLNHGVSKVLDEVLEYNEYNEFYQIDLLKKENHHLRYKTFDELLISLRKQKILLIAIKVVYRDQSGKEIIDYSTIKKLLEKENLKKQVIVNPYTETEINRKTDEDDQLIVFAKNGKELKEAIRNLKK